METQICHMEPKKSYPIDRLMDPVQNFIQQEKAGGIVLGFSVIIAMILANSPWSSEYFHFLENKLGFAYNGHSVLEYSIHHWINDGLMAVFFFVVGLELKREFIEGELSEPRKAMLPIVAAVGGMVVPAMVYFLLNPSGEPQKGWGIPMATDIAFSLGVLYLLGNKIPLSLKIFLTALAIVDDLGAVLVIAFFYTTDINEINLLFGLGFLFLMITANKLGVKNILVYAVLGIMGVWTSFLVSGIHSTIAAVLAAFTIPAGVSVRETFYINRINQLLSRFKASDHSNVSKLNEDQLHVLEKIQKETNAAIPPLQKLEHILHPVVTFLVIPVFALANAGISLDMDYSQLFTTNIALGVALGLLIGKVTGITAFTLLSIKLKLAIFPEGMNTKNLVGLGFLAGIGFTMSLFITSLAFTVETYLIQAKVGIFTASILSGVLGYYFLKNAGKKSIGSSNNSQI